MLTEEQKQRLLEQHEQRARYRQTVADANLARAIKLSEELRKLNGE